MGKIIRRICIATILAIVILPVLVIAYFLNGNVYRKVGSAALEANGYPKSLAIYKAANKPFLIIGPCRFHEGEEYEDFFFVNKTQVIRTATDKGGDLWYRTFNWLHIIDDLSDYYNLVRAPYWDELQSNAGTVRFDDTANSYIYSFKIELDTTPVVLTIPARFFTPDMIDAPNVTHFFK